MATNNQPFAIGRAMLLVSTVGVLGAGGAWGGLTLLGLGEQAWMAVLAAGICWLASLIALLPMLGVAGHPIGQILNMAMAGAGIRLMGVIGGVALVLGVWGRESRSVLLYAIGWYVLFQVIDIRFVLAYFRSVASQVQAASTETMETDPC